MLNGGMIRPISQQTSIFQSTWLFFFPLKSDRPHKYLNERNLKSQVHTAFQSEIIIRVNRSHRRPSHFTLETGSKCASSGATSMTVSMRIWCGISSACPRMYHSTDKNFLQLLTIPVHMYTQLLCTHFSLFQRIPVPNFQRFCHVSGGYRAAVSVYHVDFLLGCLNKLLRWAFKPYT